MKIKKYPIDETAARDAQRANSMDAYIPGSATRDYQIILTTFENAVQDLIDRNAKKQFPATTEELELVTQYADRYSTKLADAINRKNRIDARVPSVLISGPGNFPVYKKEQQNASREKFWQESGEIFDPTDNYFYRKIMKLLTSDAIRSDDAIAIEKLEAKLRHCRENQVEMRNSNAYFRLHKTMCGYPGLSDEEARKMDAAIDEFHSWDKRPYPEYCLSNNNAEIHRIEKRIALLKKMKERSEIPSEQKYLTIAGVKVVENAELMRVQLFFDDKPDDSIRALLKSHGFRWAPAHGAWQRQLTPNGIFAAKRVLKQLYSDGETSV